MSNAPQFLSGNQENSNETALSLPLAAMVRALCQAATRGPDLLYEVILKLTLMVDSTAQTYGLATWTQKTGERPHLKWAEGLEPEEIEEAEAVVMSALSSQEKAAQISAGDQAICMVLTTPTPN